MEGKVDPRHLDARIAELAGRQHGVVSAAQLHELGLTARQVESRLRAGRLHRVERGVYAVGHMALTREGRWMAAVLSCGNDAVLSHRAAAAHWGIRRSWRGRIDVTVPRRSGLSPGRTVSVHRVRSLMDDEWTVHEGIPLTTVARLLLDLASAVSRRELERAVEESERLALFDLRAIEALMHRYPKRPGSPALRAVLDAYRDDYGLTRSELERRFLDLCEIHGIACPAVNTTVGPFEVDFLWATQRLIVECDGRKSHGTWSAFERDRARDAWLTAHGYRVVRFTWRRVLSDSDEVARLLRRLLVRSA